MKRLLIFISFILVHTAVCCAQDSVPMRDVFSQMPDSLLPYLSHNNKLDLIDFVESGMESQVTNSFDEKTRLLKLTPDYLLLQASDMSTVQLKLLRASAAHPDSTTAVVCMVSTYGTASPVSTVCFYTSKWRSLDMASPLSGVEDRLVARPDTMDTGRYEMLRRSAYPLMVSAELSATEDILIVKANAGMMPTDDEKKAVEPLFRQITLKWNGENFKEN